MLTTKQQIERLNEQALIFNFDFDASEIKQKSIEWHRMRKGRITATGAYKIISEGRAKGSYSKERRTYMLDLAHDICANAPIKDINVHSMQWGVENEPKALKAYDPFGKMNLTEMPFIFSDCMRYGISPDILVNDNGLAEVKCPTSGWRYMERLFNSSFGMDIAAPEEKMYFIQKQFQLWVTKREWVDSIYYDPNMKKNNIVTKRVYPNDDIFLRFEVEMPKFIDELDDLLDTAGFSFDWVLK